MQNNDVQAKDREAQIKIIEQDCLDAWRSHNFPEIDSLSDIKSLRKKLNGSQVDYLLEWIPKVSNEFSSREMLVRALILASKPFDGTILMKLFDDPDSSFYLRWAIANTISSANVKNVIPWLKKKFESLSLGREKEMLVYALGEYLPTDEARSYLVKVFDNYPGHAATTLAKIGGREDLDFLLGKGRNFKGPQKGTISKAIKKLEKKLSS